MELNYLSIESLKVNPDNFFKPLPDKEYEDLLGSIAQYGIQEPLIVTQDGDDSYTIISGNNRFRAAMEIGIKILPCIVIDLKRIEGAMDSEIFRRHLSPEERAEYKALKETKCEEIVRKKMEERLLPDLFQQYKRGFLTRETAIEVMKFNVEEQAALLDTLNKIQPALADDDGVIPLQEEISHLKEALSKKTQEIMELKSWKEENRERLEEKLAELEKKKSKASEVVKKEFEKEVKNLIEVNEKLVSQIRQKQAEIDRIEEEKERFKRALSDKEIGVKAEKIHFAEAKQKYMINIITAHGDMIVKEIKTIRNLMEFDLSKREVLVTQEKIKNIYKELDELSADVNKSIALQQ